MHKPIDHHSMHKPIDHRSMCQLHMRSESATQGVTTHLGPVALEPFPLEGKYWGQVLVQPGS